MTMAPHLTPKREIVTAYRQHLRRTAMAIPKAVIEKAIFDIHTRAKAVVATRSGDVARD